jgi:hypothetical protein
MFAMFFFLSLFVQQIVGYSPLRAGFAFVPFSFGMVAAAITASRLVSRTDPRYLAGTGTLIAAFSLFMFSRLSVDDSPAGVLHALASGSPVGADVSYWAHIFPYVLTMSFGMGLVFVPLTLTAVHHVRAQDSGIGSGVLNTMQQVGGALGLATLSTVSLHFTHSRATEVAAPLVAGLHRAGIDPTALVPGTDQSYLAGATFYATFTHGATHAFLIGSLMMLIASAIIWVFLDVKHTELATDGHEAVPVA